MTPARRALTATEKYFTFLDQVVPINVLLVAELDRVLPVEAVAAGWQRFRSMRSLARLAVSADLTIGESQVSSDATFAAKDVPSSRFDEQLGLASTASFGLDRPAQCRYFTSAADGRSRLLLVYHHAVLDGRIGVTELQWLLRLLDGQEIPEQRGLSVPRPREEPFDWQQDRDAYRALLARISAHNNEAGVPGPSWWTQPGTPRRPRFTIFTLDSPFGGQLREQAAAAGTSLYPANAAAWLRATADVLVGKDAGTTLQLATSADLSAAPPAGDAPPAPIVGLLGGRYHVAADAPWELARTIRARLDEALKAGEGDLFFRLTRADSIERLDAGVRAVARQLEQAPPSVSATNLGRFDAESDPPWLDFVCACLSPAPNQILYSAALTHRDRFVQFVATDDTQIDPDVSRGLLPAYLDHVREMAGLPQIVSQQPASEPRPADV